MERFFKLLYYYFLGMLVLLTVYLTVMLAVAPRNDALKRGFIPCTEAFVLRVSKCERGSIGCMTAGIWNDTKCNLYVIFDGMGAWIRGRQPTPWANYLFVPTTSAEQDTENPYIGVVSEDIKALDEQRRFLEDRQKELEEAKQRNLNLNDKILQVEDIENYKEKTTEEPAEQIGYSNIDDEAFMEDFADDKADETKAQTPKSESENAKAVLKINAKKSVEKKGEINDK